MKKYHSKIIFIIIFILGFLITPGSIKAAEYSGTGLNFPTASGRQCSHGSGQICFYNNTTGNGHATYKATLYYFRAGQNLSNPQKRYGSLTYSTISSLVSQYDNVLALPYSGTFGTISASMIKSFFTEEATFVDLFRRVVGVAATSETDVVNWMKTECQNTFGISDINNCTTGIGGAYGFRIVIEPLVSYQNGDKHLEFDTVKSAMRNNSVWNQSSTLASLANLLYLDEADLVFPSVSPMSSSTSKSTIISTVASSSSSYGFNIMAWPVEINGICPAPIGEECSQQYYNVDGCCNCKQAAASKYSDAAYIKNKFRNQNYPTCEVAQGNGCSYKLNVNIPSTCTSGTSGKVSDKIDLTCLYKSHDNSNDTTVKEQYFIASNNYCAIYCEEEIDFEFPDSNGTMLAGTYFVIADSGGEKKVGPITYKGKKTCKVTGEQGKDIDIKVEQFINDFVAANNRVISAWDEWQYKELQKEVADAGVAHHWSETCRHTWCDHYVTILQNQVCDLYKSCSENRSGTYYTYNNRTYYGNTFSRNTSISNGSCSCRNNRSCGYSCDSRVSVSTSSARNAYYDAVAARNNLLGQIRQCSSYVNLYTEFFPLVNFTYTDPTYGPDAGTIKLKVSPFGQSVSGLNSISSLNDTSSSGARTKGFTSNTDASRGSEGTNSNPKSNSYGYSGYNLSLNPGSTGQIIYWDCGRSATKQRCTSQSYATYPTNRRWESTTTRNYSYTLPDNLYNYIDKTTGWSYKSGTGGSTNYTYIDFSNLPIHYSTKPNTYRFNVLTTTYGTNDVFSKYVLRTTAYNGQSYYKNENANYRCTYKVRDNPTIICTKGSTDPKCDSSNSGNGSNGGTNVIYRPISLYYPFPGINATSTRLRAPGDNWSSESIVNYIYNNRSTKASYYQVYQLDPMYEVELTPALMMKIRQYNKEQTNSYSDFTLVCKKNGNDKNEQCVSTVIRDDWNVRGCAISKDHSRYTNCGTTVAW